MQKTTNLSSFNLLNVNGQATASKYKRQGSSISITPELAATVVKDYLLPMFDNDGRKLLKRKNKVSSFSFASESTPFENSSGIESKK